MKKIYLVIFTAFLTFALFAQDVSRTNDFGRNQYVRRATRSNPSGQDYMVATDTLGSVDQDTIQIIYNVNKAHPVPYIFGFNFDSLTGTPVVVVTLKGRMIPAIDSWTDISSTTWNGTSSDTTFKIETANRGTQAITLTGTDTSATTVLLLDTIFTYTDTTSVFPHGLDISVQADSGLFYRDSAYVSTYGTGTQYNATTMTGTLTTTGADYRQLMLEAVCTAGTAAWDNLYAILRRRE